MAAALPWNGVINATAMAMPSSACRSCSIPCPTAILTGNSDLVNYRTWLLGAGIRYYETRLLPKQFFWEPQAGLSLGYVFPYTISGDAVTYRSGNKPM